MLQPSVAMETEDNSNKMWQQLAEVITPSIVKVVDFAKNVPGFEMVCKCILTIHIFMQCFVDDDPILRDLNYCRDGCIPCISGKLPITKSLLNCLL